MSGCRLSTARSPLVEGPRGRVFGGERRIREISWSRTLTGSLALAMVLWNVTVQCVGLPDRDDAQENGGNPEYNASGAFECHFWGN